MVPLCGNGMLIRINISYGRIDIARTRKSAKAIAATIVGSRALSFSDPYFHFTCLSVRHSVIRSVVLSVRNFGAKYLGNEAR